MESNYWTNVWRQGRTSRRRFISTAGAMGAGVAGLSLVGCGDDDDDEASNGGNGDNGENGGDEQPENGSGDFDETATLRSAVASDVGSLDPQSVAGTGGGNWLNYQVHFVPMMQIDPESNEIVSYAVDWEWTEENDALILTVQDGIEFTNGEALDAETIAFNLDRVLGRAEYNPDYEGGHASNYQAAGSIDVTDDMTLRIEMAEPDVSLPYQLAYPAGMPVVPRQYIIDNGDEEFARNPVGLGPFEFVSHSADTELVSRRAENYFQPRDANLGPRTPYVQDLVQRVMPEAGARLSALEAGEVDLVGNIPADLAEAWEDRSGFQVFYLPGEQPMHIHFNTVLENDATGNPGDNPWRDRRVREAANLAVDLDTIIETILTGREQKSFGTSQRAFGFPEELKDEAWGFDPDRARELLAEAGYEDGFETLFTGPTERWPNTRPVMEAIAGYLGDVGITCNIELSQYADWISRVQSKELPGMWFMGLSGGADPATNFQFGYMSDGAYCSSYDPESNLDELIDESLNTFDSQARNELNAEIIRTHYEFANWLYLYEPVGVAIGTDQLEWEYYNSVIEQPEYWNIKVRA